MDKISRLYLLFALTRNKSPLFTVLFFRAVKNSKVYLDLITKDGDNFITSDGKQFQTDQHFKFVGKPH